MIAAIALLRNRVADLNKARDFDPVSDNRWLLKRRAQPVIIATMLAFESLEELRGFVRRTEAAHRGQADPFYVHWYNARRILSCFSWDIFTASCLAHYAEERQPKEQPLLSEAGVITGSFEPSIADELLTAFRASPLYDPPISGHEVADGHFFGPGVSESTAEHTRAEFRTRKMTGDMSATLKRALDAIAVRIEEATGYFWRTSHVRLYERRPQDTPPDSGWHVDGWPIGICKLYIYLEGASEDLGTTQIRVSEERTVTVEGGPGVWAIFPNSVVVHRALSSRHKWRPAIEVPILPALKTDTTPIHMGPTGNFPWYPIDLAALSAQNVPRDFAADNLEFRSLLRTVGLARNIPFADCSGGVDPFHTPEGWSRETQRPEVAAREGFFSRLRDKLRAGIRQRTL